jgi:putative oxidoreductase
LDKTNDSLRNRIFSFYLADTHPTRSQRTIMRHLFYCDTAGWLGSAGLLPVRLVMGTAFLFHGWPKIQDPFGWMGPDASIPAAFLAMAALAEFGGGIALILGLLTRIASLGIASVMVVAIGTVHLPNGHPFVSQGGGHSCELAAVYLTCGFLFLSLGPGRCSLDASVFGRSRKEIEGGTERRSKVIEGVSHRSSIGGFGFRRGQGFDGPDGPGGPG